MLGGALGSPRERAGRRARESLQSRGSNAGPCPQPGQRGRGGGRRSGRSAPPRAGLQLQAGSGVGMEVCHRPYLPGLAPFPTCLGTIWRLLYLLGCDSGRRAVLHCLAEEVGRRHGNMPVSPGIPAGAGRSAWRPSCGWVPATPRNPSLPEGLPRSVAAGDPPTRGAPGTDRLRACGRIPVRSTTDPRRDTLLVGGKRGSAVPDSREPRQRSCDSAAGLAPHPQVTARSSHPGWRGAGASPHARCLEEPLSHAHLPVLLRGSPKRSLRPPP